MIGVPFSNVHHRKMRLVHTAPLAIVAAFWLPYLAVRLYWEYLLRTVPGASHGEISGPILYFLPRLVSFALAGTVIGLIFAVFAALWRNRVDSTN
jgi:hypothetical protein